MEYYEIIVCRHPEKNGDLITAKGAMQAWAAAEALMNKHHFTPELVAYSGANRALQAAKVMAAAMGIPLGPGEPEKLSGFHFQVVFEKYFPGAVGRDEFFHLKEELDRKNGGQATLAEALAAGGKIQAFAEEGRQAMRQAIVYLAMKMMMMGEGRTTHCLVVSHSPWAELAHLVPETVPFGLGEADAMSYIVSATDYTDTESQFQISASVLIPAPLRGKGSYK